ncbi:MAG: ABC transporter permease [Balneolaceae bacterium]
MMQKSPPKLAEKILSKLLYDDVWKTTLGDFEEYYLYLLENEGKEKANTWYWQQVLKYAPSKIIHKIYWSIGMFKNYLKIAFRSLKKQKSYSFINIFGLAIGLTCFVLIGLFIQYEMSYDTFHEDSDRTYRVIAKQPGNEYLGSEWFALTPTAMAVTMKQDFPEVEYASYFGNSRTLMINNERSFIEWGVAADEDFFKTFSYQWFRGNSETALDDPNSMILTQSMAEKLFGDENPINETVDQVYPNGKTVSKTVTGVISDPPKNSHFSFQYVVNDQSTPYYKYNLDEWSNTNNYTFITLKEGVSAEEFSKKLPGFADTYIAATDYYESNPDKLPIHTLQPLEDIHLKSSYLNFNPSSLGDIKYVYMFSIIAVIILLIACVNYMNLSTARSLTRAKEVGVRKVIGAVRSNLMMQFISEAVVISLLSIIGAMVIITGFLPIFSELVDRELTSQIFFSWKFWGFAVTTSLLVGIISGSYPAFYMSKLKPALILKSQVAGGKGNTFLRNLLVIGQFTITVVLVIGSIVVFKQLDYIKTTDTGLNRDQIIAISSSDPELWDSYETLEQELFKNPAIQTLSTSQYQPTQMSSRTLISNWDELDEGEELNIYISPVGFNFVEMLGIEVVAGRSFTKEQYKETSTDYLINEATLRELGWSADEAIGKSFAPWGSEGTIVGVVQDFNFLSLYQEIAPLTIMLAPGNNQRYVLVKVNSTNMQETIASLEDTFKEFSPAFPFSYSFLDETYNNMYQSDLRLGQIFNYFTLLALIIACLGLFGLATFVTQQRTKEIGIRKVLGANILQIISLLNKDFLKLVGFSFVLAAPIGWYLAQTWLQDFAFKISLNPLIFVVAGIITFGIAMLTVSYKSIRTATANPVDSLKSE